MIVNNLDDNQTEIVNNLIAIGCSVQRLNKVKCGCPDILVGRYGHNYLFEIKNPKVIPSKRALTPAEKKWHESWRGKVYIVETFEEILNIMEGKKHGKQ